MAEPIPFCDRAFADTFIGAHRWKEYWVAAEDSEKDADLVHATQVIIQFCKFFDDDGEEIHYIPESTDDENIPDWLRQAACYEALYFFDLENDPSRPFPLGILGIIKDEKTTFDHNYEPPLFSQMARQLLENNGALVEDPYGNQWGIREWV